MEKKNFLNSFKIKQKKSFWSLETIINLILIYLLSFWAYERMMRLRKKIRDEYYEMKGDDIEVELTDEEKQKEDDELDEEIGGDNMGCQSLSLL